MAYRKWHVPLNHGECVVELEHSYWTTHQVVRLNGAVVVDSYPLGTLANRYRFPWNGHEFVVIVGRRWLTLRVKYTLLVDGQVVDPVAGEAGEA